MDRFSAKVLSDGKHTEKAAHEAAESGHVATDEYVIVVARKTVHVGQILITTC